MSGNGVTSIPAYQSMISTMNANPPTVLISLDELANSNAALKATELANKQSLEAFDSSVLMNNLHTWAGTGFQASYPVYQLQVVTPVKTTSLYNCSDGTPRNVWDYIPFCLGYPITTLVATFQQKVTGMTFSFSLEEVPSIVLKIHVSK
jgi:hypothetical protein